MLSNFAYALHVPKKILAQTIIKASPQNATREQLEQLMAYVIPELIILYA